MAAVLVAALVGAALTAFVVVGRDRGPDDGTAAGLRLPAPVSSAAPAAPTAPAAPIEVAPATAPPSQGVASPDRVVVSRLAIDMSVEPTGVDQNGQMGLPPDPAVAGWYQYGAAPVAAGGAVVVAAHVDSRTMGVGPFSRLGGARAGDEVDLWVGGTQLTYRVSQVARVDKVHLDAEGLFSMTGPARLHLVTCTGDYAAGSGYAQNLVVVADRVSP